MKLPDRLSKVIHHLACPAHQNHGGESIRQRDGSGLEGPVCGRFYPIIDGVIYFIPEYDHIRRPERSNPRPVN